MNNYTRTEKYDKDFLAKNMMGPNSMMILEELSFNTQLKKGMRVLDLGCGNGLTSIFLAKEFGVQVFAVDLWISASDNFERFKSFGLEDKIIPIHSDANELPFADNYFDAVISIDSYHYFANNDSYFTDKLLPLIKEDGIVAISFPGMKYELHDDVPEHMKKYWDSEALKMWQCIDWWKPKFENSLKDFSISEMPCFDDAWKSWFSSKNPYAISDMEMISADNNRYMNIIGVKGVKK